MPTTHKSVLDGIVAHKRLELIKRKQQHPLDTFQHQVEPLPKADDGPLEQAFQREDRATRLMLEIKPSSPSLGVLQAAPDIEALATIYAQAGVAISVLTDQKYFGGSLENLTQVQKICNLPVLCKDFIVDPYQVYEARLAGASAVLLIVKSLTDLELSELTTLIRSLGMTPLIEIQNEEELQRSLAVEPTILLINNRNLQTLDMDMTTTKRLAPLTPAGILKVSASGIEKRTDINALQPYCDGFLIGSSLMKQSLEALPLKLQELLG